ncbi:MAG: flagellar biosynthesis protein FlhF [Bacteroidetes bacterium]|nr:flagellar biosynthesis protein FlhF [Bacteroidota bacterium]
MQIKKFVAPTLKQASMQMKMEMGGDAVILGTRVIYGESKTGSKRMFEITAGIEEEDILEYADVDSKQKSAGSRKSFSGELQKLSDKIFINPVQEREAFKPKQSVPNSRNNQNLNIDVEKELKEVVDTLFAREVQKPIISSILNQLKKYKNFLHPSNIDSYVISSVASMIPTYHFEVHTRKKAKTVALVGPTGVGKTTCIAKLAVISKILHNLDVGLISIDTYRLGAIDQLRIFSEISNIDMLVAYEPSDMPKLINSFKKKDIIFIDTAGRSQNNFDQLKKAKEFLTAANAAETYLVLSSTGTTKNMLDVSEKFKLFGYDSVIFTKIDEAAAFGNILNVVSNFDVPISFLSNGQVIPDDIISADPEFIANMIYTGKFN